MTTLISIIASIGLTILVTIFVNRKYSNPKRKKGIAKDLLLKAIDLLERTKYVLEGTFPDEVLSELQVASLDFSHFKSNDVIIFKIEGIYEHQSMTIVEHAIDYEVQERTLSITFSDECIIRKLYFNTKDNLMTGCIINADHIDSKYKDRLFYVVNNKIL